MTTSYWVRTDDDDVPILLIRVVDHDTVDVWNVRDAGWVPTPNPSATLGRLEPGYDDDYSPVSAVNVPGIIARLNGRT